MKEDKNTIKTRYVSDSDFIYNYFSLESDSQAEVGDFLDTEGTILEKYFNAKLKLFLGAPKDKDEETTKVEKKEEKTQKEKEVNIRDEEKEGENKEIIQNNSKNEKITENIIDKEINPKNEIIFPDIKKTKETKYRDILFPKKINNKKQTNNKFNKTNLENCIKKYITDKIEQNKTKEMLSSIETIFEEMVNDIEIDSLIRNIPGHKIKFFLKSFENYSFSSVNDTNKIDDNKTYYVVGEIAINIVSRLKKKIEQIKCFYALLSKLFEFFSKYLNDLNELFLLILEYLNVKVDAENKLNVIYLIITNHSYKGFKKFKEAYENSSMEEKLNEKIKELFNLKNELRNKKGKKEEKTKKNTMKSTIKESNNKNNKKYKNDNPGEYQYNLSAISSIKNLIKSLAQLINNINNNKNSLFYIVYFDNYLNYISPREVIEDTLNNLNKSVDELKKKMLKYKKD